MDEIEKVHDSLSLTKMGVLHDAHLLTNMEVHIATKMEVHEALSMTKMDEIGEIHDVLSFQTFFLLLPKLLNQFFPVM